MGLIKAGAGSLGGVLADQWKEFFYCDALPETVLVVKGSKRTSARSSNTKASDNIITSGSVIAVADGQCMLIVEQGKVVEVCAEPGEFIFDASTEPSIFAGGLNWENIKAVFGTIGKRFTFGGEPPKDQRVYYFNTKEITGNKFGTANAVPFKVVINEQLGFKLSVDLRMHGTYSYKITNPLSFYQLCGNVEQEYTRDRIDDMLRAELVQYLQPALAELSAAGISYDQIPAKTEVLKDALNRALVNDWGKRGIEVYSMNIGVPSIPDEQRKKITEWEETAMLTDPNARVARMAGATAEGMITAAGNEGGAMAGFMGMGMAMNQGGAVMQSMYGTPQQQPLPQQPAAPAAPAADSWTCSCGATVTGNFCPECGKPRPTGWVCPKCGKSDNKGKFCSECGAAKPQGMPKYKCDKCGWEPEDPTKPPKFCPECGDPFDDQDIQK